MKKMPEGIKQAIRNKFAWPGGYPFFLVMHDCEALCIDCSKKNYRLLVQDTVYHESGTWRVEGADINWEDAYLYCCHCNNRIESAYAEGTGRRMGRRRRIMFHVEQ